MLENLEPKRVIFYFEEISKIPRCSGNEKGISDYLKNFAEKHGLFVHQDEYLNIIIRKEASPGYENSPPVILQGHMDMVCEKTTDSNHDFTKDPIEILVDGEIMTANKTTLGADDGIAIAMGLAILESNTIPHPMLELLVTISEETDMSGALNLSSDILKGKQMINIDSEEEGILTVGSAGGVTLFITRKIEKEKCDWRSYKIEFDGLKGGHSGMEIDKNRGNMLKVMAYFLKIAKEKFNYKIQSIVSGKLDNAIPRSGKLEIYTESEIEDKIESVIEKTIKEFAGIDGNLEIKIEKSDNKSLAWKDDIRDKLIEMIIEMPTGVNTILKEGNLVESSNNLALIKEIDDKIYLENSIRSSNIKVQKDLVNKCIKVLENYNFDYKLDSEYPGWEFNEKSSLRELAQKVYNKMYGKDFETIVVHAGLECGAIASKYPKMDMISIGPNINGAHTPQESMEIDSAKRVYEYILELLKEMK